MLLEVHHNGPLGMVVQTANLDCDAVNRICDYIRSMNRDIAETYIVGPKTKFRRIDINSIAEERRGLVYDMIDTELAQQEEDQQDG